MAARLMGFQTWDMEFLHMAAKRQMGSMDLLAADVRGDDAEKLLRRWEKPKNWYGRANREWRLGSAGAPYTARFDTLDMAVHTSAAAEVVAEGHRKAFLWLGVRGKVDAQLNGETVASIASDTTFRIGQFQYPVELKPGRNRLEFKVQPIDGQAKLSLLLTGPRNDGDTVEGIRWVNT